MCNEAVQANPYTLGYVPGRYKMARVYEKIVERGFGALMYERVTGASPWLLWCVPDRFTTQEMWSEVVRMNPWLLKYVPDWFVTQ